MPLGGHRPLPRPERLDADGKETHYQGDFENVPLRDAPELRGEARKAAGALASDSRNGRGIK